jgi:hypothetical protein
MGKFSEAFADLIKKLRPSAATDEPNAWTFDIPIAKSNPDQGLVFGWANVVDKDGKTVIDSQGDTISEAELEKAFYEAAMDGFTAGENHQDVGEHIGKMVECMVFTKEKQAVFEASGIAKFEPGFVGAWVGFKVNPDIMAKVKNGTYKSFSIGGSGVRVAA